MGESPYTLTEVVTGRLWRVKYEFVKGSVDTKAAKQSAALGWNPLDPGFEPKVLAGAKQFGDKALEVALQDIAKAVDLYGRESVSDKEFFELCPRSVNSYVVKLKNGSLLLYAPVKIRDEIAFGAWLDGLGMKRSNIATDLMSS